MRATAAVVVRSATTAADAFQSVREASGCLRGLELVVEGLDVPLVERGNRVARPVVIELGVVAATRPVDVLHLGGGAADVLADGREVGL